MATAKEMDVPTLTKDEIRAWRDQQAAAKAAEEAAAVEAKRVAEAAEEAAAKAATDAAAAKQEAEALVAKQAEEKAARAKAPGDYVGLVLEGMQEPDYHRNTSAPNRDRTITIGGVVFEHTTDDADGIWLYRRLG